MDLLGCSWSLNIERSDWLSWTALNLMVYIFLWMLLWVFCALMMILFPINILRIPCMIQCPRLLLALLSADLRFTPRGHRRSQSSLILICSTICQYSMFMLSRNPYLTASSRKLGISWDQSRQRTLSLVGLPRLCLSGMLSLAYDWAKIFLMWVNILPSQRFKFGVILSNLRGINTLRVKLA
jgi:hypothetical protein